MALPVPGDRGAESSTTTGTGTYSLDAALPGWRTIVEACGDGATVDYYVRDNTQTSDYEVGQGVITAGSPSTLTRDTIYASSNGGAAVNWASGTRNIVVTFTANGFAELLNIANHTGQVDTFEFNQTPTGTPGEAKMQWNPDDATVDIGMLGGNVTLQVGQESLIHYKADSTITDGQVLYASGAVGASSKLSADPFIANGSIPENRTIGVATEDVSIGDFGYCTTEGVVRGISTDGSSVGETWADGDILYASSTTAGALTKVPPTPPNPRVTVAMVLAAHATNGSIYVRPSVGATIDELHDVYLPTVSDGDVIKWINANSRWEAYSSTNWDTAYGWGNHASAGYVVADGAVVINESGADVDFRIESDTNANAFFLEGSNGNVGIGTSLPSYKAEIDSGSLGTSLNDRLDALRLATNTSNVDTLNFSKIRTSAGTDWTTAGWRLQQRVDAVNMGYIQFNGDSNNIGISFGRDDSSEHMRITSLGRVGIGTASPSTKLDVNGAVTIDGILLEDSSDRSGLLEINRLGSTGWTGTQVNFSSTAKWSVMGNQTSFGIYDDYNSDWILQHTQNAGISLYYGGSGKLSTTSSGVSVTGSLTASGDVTAYSDERLKENWKDLPEGFVANLAGVKSGTYNRIDLDGKQQVGVSAQSLQTVLPDAVIESNDTLAVNYGNAALASAIELAKKVVELEARIKELEGK